MPQNPQRLELTWIGKGEEPQLEPRILIEDTDKSYGDPGSENMLIHGDNLLALKALEQEYAGKVKCIYIDPPYNTGSAFEHYDDGIEHSLWLNLVKTRLDILRRLISEDGSIWVSIDDTEYGYLRVLMDEIFGRSNFIASIIWEKRKTRENRRAFSFKHDYVVAYAQEKSKFEGAMNKLPLNDQVLSRYKNPDNDLRGPWQSISLLAQAGHATQSQFYILYAPNGKGHKLPKGNCWRYTEAKINEEIKDNRIWFGKSGNNAPRIKKFLSETDQSGLTPETIWYADEVGTTDTAKKHSLKVLKASTVFDTPKSEELIERIIHISSNKGDLVLDSFLGSGTTAAVAHKMGRRWIGIELGEHANTHCLPRLKKVVDGLDEGGITKSAGWKGGGGFRFYNLAPSLLREDDFGNWVIDERYNPDMLAAAMAKQEGYRYAPDETCFWKQGKSTENDYLFTTTQLVTVELVERIAEQMTKGESLLICCKSFQKEAGKRDARIDVKKIPSTLLGRCEFGKDDYSLSIIDMPTEGEPNTFEPAARKAEREVREEEKRKYGEQAKMFGSS